MIVPLHFGACEAYDRYGILHVLGIDLGNDYSGIGMITVKMDDADYNARLSISLLRRVHVDGRPERMSDALDGIDSYPSPIAIEEPPPTMPRAVRHGPQALIGWRLGVLGGVAWATARARFGTDIRFVPVSVWRGIIGAKVCPVLGLPAVPVVFDDPIREASIAHGVDRIDPPGSDARGTRVVHYRCGVQRSMGWKRGAPDVPPLCGQHKTKAAKTDPHEQKRQAWKAWACAVVSKLAPEEYARLVADARASARTDKPDHLLSGVPDACEGALVAVATLLDLVSPSAPEVR